MQENEPRLRGVEQKIDRLLVSVEGLANRFDGQEKEQRNFREVLHGDGNGKRGILIRIDRLEQTSTRLGKLLWIVFGAATTALIFQIVG